MTTESLVFAKDPGTVTAEVGAAGGRILHELTEHLLVISVPDDVSADSILGAPPAEPAALKGTERALAKAWISKFGHVSRATEKLAELAAEPALPWDTPGHTPPDRLPGRKGRGLSPEDATKRSTNTPTSVTLTGSVAVGIVMVSGPAVAPTWTPVDGALTYVSVAADRTVWGVNAAGQVYRRDGDSWQRIAGSLKQISVGDAGNIWGVNKNDEIYRWNGNAWDRVSGALKQVSVAADGTVWGVNADDDIYQRKGTGWVQVSGKLKQLSVSSASLVWGVNSTNQIYTNDPALGLAFNAAEKADIMSEVLQGLTFLATLDPSANVSFVHDWQDITVSAGPGAGDDYEEFEAPWRNAALKKMGFAASRSGSVAYVNSLRSSRKTNWAYVAYFTKYPLHHFAYAGDERLVMDYRNDGWGTPSIDRVFAHESCHIFGAADEYEGSGCDCAGSGHYDVPNKNCSNCTSAQIPCLMNRNTLSLCAWSQGQLGWSPWEQIAGALKHVSVAGDGTVWGVNANDEIFRRDGNAWKRIAGSLKQISTGAATLVWGVNKDNKIYRRDGNAWKQVSGALKHVTVAADGTVWGVNANDQIYRWTGIAWEEGPGALTQISTGAATLVWGVNNDNKIYRRK